MKFKFLTLFGLFLLSASFNFAQQTPTNYPTASQEIARMSESVEIISRDMSGITKSIDELNKNLKSFFESFSSNQGLQLSERQQKMLLAFEILNRTEQRVATLQKFRLDLIEKQSVHRIQLARVSDDLLPESIDRYVSTRGTTNAEQVREIRRQALVRERNDLTALLNDIQRELQETVQEIGKTELFLRNIRQKLFPELEKELSNF
jgi:hypothetical protein